MKRILHTLPFTLAGRMGPHSLGPLLPGPCTRTLSVDPPQSGTPPSRASILIHPDSRFRNTAQLNDGTVF